MAEYRLSVRARLQLLDIFEFTASTFGHYQAEAYLAGLDARSAFSQTSHVLDNRLMISRRDIVDFVSNPIKSSTRKKPETS
jgi:plasmid stabilization system protein ParE